MYKIKVQSKVSVFAFIVIAIIAVVLCVFAVYVIHFADFASSRTKGDSGALIGMVFIFLPIFFKSAFGKEKYLSYILVSDDYFTLFYKQGGKLVERKEILKNDIVDFSLNARLGLMSAGKGQVCICTSNTIIKLKNKQTIQYSHDSSSQLFGCPYQYILDILKIQNQISNFRYSLDGENEFAKEDIRYFIRFGKRMPPWISLKYSTKNMPIASKIILGMCFGLTILSFGMLIFLNIPCAPLNNDEKEFMVHYNKASDLRIKEDNNKQAIEELEKAKTYASDNPELYLELAYNYEDLKEYQKAIDYAKEGLKYVNNTKSPYRRYHNFKFLSKKDIAIYSIIAKCERKLKNYPQAIEAYSYVIKHSHYMYDDSHFWRGYCYYYSGQKALAHKDFLAHKEIILKYFKDQEESEYKDKYPRYDQENMDNVEAWIRAAL